MLELEPKGLFNHYDSSSGQENPYFNLLLCADILGDLREHTEFVSHFLSRFHSFYSRDDGISQTHKGEDRVTKDYKSLKDCRFKF